MRLSASRLVVIGVGVIVVLALVIVLTRRSDSTSSAVAPDQSSSADAGPSSGSSATETTGVPPVVAGEQPGQSASAAAAGLPAAVAELPVELTVSNTSGLRDGDVVTVHAAADSGAAVYGLEARLCIEGAPANYDADLYPTVSGNCVVTPLSAQSDDHVTAAGVAPYQSVDLSFRVGTGTDTFSRQDGGTASITCGAGNPCQLSVKVQIPYGFGFRTYPLTFA